MQLGRDLPGRCELLVQDRKNKSLNSICSMPKHVFLKTYLMCVSILLHAGKCTHVLQGRGGQKREPNPPELELRAVPRLGGSGYRPQVPSNSNQSSRPLSHISSPQARIYGSSVGVHPGSSPSLAKGVRGAPEVSARPSAAQRADRKGTAMRFRPAAGTRKSHNEKGTRAGQSAREEAGAVRDGPIDEWRSGSGGSGGMERLRLQLARFSELLAVARGPRVRAWDAAAVRRALQWARYLRHVHLRFAGHCRLRDALERLLPASPGLRGFAELRRADARLGLRLLRNRALAAPARRGLLRLLFPGPSAPGSGDALQSRLARLARHGSALRLLQALRPAPGDALLRTHADLLRARLRQLGRAEPGAGRALLGALWARGPREHVLSVAAQALLPPGPEALAEPDCAGTPAAVDETPELLHWLLESAEVTSAFCRRLPPELLAAVAGRHPALSGAYLRLLTAWAGRLHYDLRKGSWVGAGAEDVPWEELCSRFQSLCRSPTALRAEVLAALRSCKERDGDFEVPGLSVWTDLLLALPGGA